MRKFYPFFLFLRAILNIPIQTLIISPWLLFRKMIISQLELESPVHAAALVAFFFTHRKAVYKWTFSHKKKKNIINNNKFKFTVVNALFPARYCLEVVNLDPSRIHKFALNLRICKPDFAGARNRYCPSDRNCRCVMKVYRYYLPRPNKVCLSYMYVKAT